MTDELTRRATLLAGLSAATGILSAGELLAGDLLARRKLRTRCCIPGYNYRPHQFTDPTSAGSTRAIAYPIDGSEAALASSSVVRLKTFQMNKASLGKDHCQISQVTVTISSDGHWYLHMQARQHPGELVTAKLRPQFERYRRNLFRVDIRPVGLMTLDRTETTSAVAKPEFPTIPVQQFWIQKDSTERIQRRGQSNLLARHFDVIKQAEIHFSYR